MLRLLEPVHDRIRRTARRLCRSNPDGDDLFHEAVLHASQRLDGLKEEAAFAAWFYAILLRLHRRRAQRGFWRRFLPLEEVKVAPPSFVEPGETYLRAQRLSAALAQLPAVQREAVVLFDVEGFTLEEICQLQRASLSAVKTRLARGRERLRALYEIDDSLPPSGAEGNGVAAGEPAVPSHPGRAGLLGEAS